MLAASSLSSVDLWADVVFLKNGDVLLVDKAWELQDEIKYQVGESVKSIAKSQVVRIKVEKGKQQEGQVRKNLLKLRLTGCRARNPLQQEPRSLRGFSAPLQGERHGNGGVRGNEGELTQDKVLSRRCRA